MGMANLIAFINAFCSYFLLFAFIVVLCLVAAFGGIKMRKNKDMKEGNIAQTAEGNQSFAVKACWTG